MTSASLNGSTAMQSSMTPIEASYKQTSGQYHNTIDQNPLRLDINQKLSSKPDPNVLDTLKKPTSTINGSTVQPSLPNRARVGEICVDEYTTDINLSQQRVADHHNVKGPFHQKKLSEQGFGSKLQSREAVLAAEKTQQRCLSSSFAYQEEQQKQASLPGYQGSKAAQTRNYDPVHGLPATGVNPIQNLTKYGNMPLTTVNTQPMTIDQQEIYTRRGDKIKGYKQTSNLRSSSSGITTGNPNTVQLSQEVTTKLRTQRDPPTSEVHNQRQPKSERVNSQKIKKKGKREFESDENELVDMTPGSQKSRLVGKGMIKKQHMTSPTQGDKQPNLFPMIDKTGEKRRIQNTQARQMSNAIPKKYSDPSQNLQSPDSATRQINSAVHIPDGQLQPAIPRTYMSYQQSSLQSPTYHQAFENAQNQHGQVLSDQLEERRPLVMGLGLGMGIQMGSDGKFYASMGGVTMPSTGHFSKEEPNIEQFSEPKQSPAIKSLARSKISKELLDDDKLQIDQQQFQNAKNKFTHKRNSKLMQKHQIDDYKEMFQLCQNSKAKLTEGRQIDQFSPTFNQFQSPVSSGMALKAQQKFSSAHAKEAAARGSYLEQHYEHLNMREQQKLAQQQHRKQMLKQQNICSDKNISKEHQQHMQMMSGGNQPVVGYHTAHAHPSELIHSQSDLRRNQANNNRSKPRVGQMSSTNDTSFTEPNAPPPDDLKGKRSHNSPINLLKQNFDDIIKAEKTLGHGKEDKPKKARNQADQKQAHPSAYVGLRSSNEKGPQRVSSLQNTSTSKNSEKQVFRSQGLQDSDTYRSGSENMFNLKYRHITQENIKLSKIADNEGHIRKKKKGNSISRKSNEMSSAGSPGPRTKRKQQNGEQGPNLQTNRPAIKTNQILLASQDDKTLQFKMLNGKRSQPPNSEAEQKEQQRQMFKAQMEHIKSNSIAALQTNSVSKDQHSIEISVANSVEDTVHQKMLELTKPSNTSAADQSHLNILKQETILETQKSPERQVSHNTPQLAAEGLEWFKKALELSRRAQGNSSESNSPRVTIESEQAFEIAKQIESQILGISQFQSHSSLPEPLGQGPVSTKQTTPNPTTTKTPTLLAPFMFINKDDTDALMNGQIKKPNMNDSHVKRARLQLERRKKQFEHSRVASNSQFQQQQSLIDQSVFGEQQAKDPQADQFTAGIGARGTQIGQGLICTPNITYKSVHPLTTKSQKTANENHPLVNQQLLNGYIKNPNAVQVLAPKHKKSSLTGVQGQNFQVLQKQLSEKQGVTPQDIQFLGSETLSVDGNVSQADLESLALLSKLASQAQLDLQKSDGPRQSRLREDTSRQNLLNAVKAAETGHYALNQAQPGAGRLIVFTQNGQTFVRNHDATKIAQLSQAQIEALGIHMESAQQLADQMPPGSQQSKTLGFVIMPEDLQRLLLLGNQIDDSANNQNRGKQRPVKRMTNAQSPSKVNLKSDGSNQSKPTTSTTLNSAKDQKGKDSKQIQSPKKNLKRKVHIWHEDNITVHHKNHRINKAITTINQIINLIFKNKKDSVALTTISKSDSLGPPANRLIDENRVNELQKIAKKINIIIPKKFESKTSLREFFFSRDFILNVKIKMNVLLQKSILESNNIPMEVIQSNMYSNYEKVKASKEAVQNGTETKPIQQIYQSKKFWVGTGNNFPVVKSVLKQRYWWQNATEESFAEDCDFIWTSWKKQRHIDYLARYKAKHEQKVEQQRRERLEGLKKKKKVVVGVSTDDDDENVWSASKSPICMPKNSQPQVEFPKEVCLETDPIVVPLKLYNRIENNKQLTNKKGIFVNMRKYYEAMGVDPFKVLPLTFHTAKGIHDPDYRKFVSYYNDLEYKIKRSDEMIKKSIKQYYKDKQKNKQTVDYSSDYDSDEEEEIQAIRKKYQAPKNTWIIKPGENTNRGQGIQVVKNMKEVQQIIQRETRQDRTFIIQKYIDYPLLVHKRKFDFRVYGMLTSINGSLKGYCYQDGYVRTSSREYNLDDVSDTLVHLTNDAIQNKSEDYGKYENANKMSFQDFTKVINAQQPDLDFDMQRDIFPQIQKLIADTFRASFHKIDQGRLHNTFELFGYDFMIDEDFRLYLIEVNTNPCLEVCCPLLARIIPEVLDNCFKIVLDPLFPSPDLSHNRKFQLNELPQEVKFQLVFDEEVDGPELRQMFKTSCKGSIREEGNEDIESDKEEELAADEGDESEFD